MALRKLDAEEKDRLNKLLESIDANNKTIVEQDVEAYSYDWRVLKGALLEAKNMESIIINNKR